VTLLFSREQYVAARKRSCARSAAHRTGLDPNVDRLASVLSAAGTPQPIVPGSFRTMLGIAIAKRIFKAYRDLLNSDRWQRILNFGARPQRFALGQDGNQRPESVGHPLYQGTGGALYGEHDAGKHF